MQTAEDTFHPLPKGTSCVVCTKPDWCRRSDSGGHECHRGDHVVGRIENGYRCVAVTPKGYGIYRDTNETRDKAPSSGPRPSSKTKQTYPTVEAAAEAAARMLGGRVAKVFRWSDTHHRARIEFDDKPKTYRPLWKSGDAWTIADPMPKPFPLCRVAELPANGPVFVVEGDPPTDAGWSIGLACVTSGAADSADSCDWSPLKGRDVVILPDNDEPGFKYALKVGGILTKLGAKSVRQLVLPDLPAKGDLADFIDARDGQEPEAIRATILKLVETDSKPFASEFADQTPAEWIPTKASDLPTSGATVSWLWFGFLAKGVITQFGGLWKAGKTTLLSHLLKCVTAGGELGTETYRGRVLYVSEEPKNLWRQRYELIQFTDDVEFVNQPFKTKPSDELWKQFISHVAAMVVSRKFDCVVLDSMANLWPVRDENNASECVSGLMPLRQITEAGAALLLIHHSRKSDDDSQGTSSRGSGALPSFCDILMEFRRFNPSEQTDRRRVLKSYSRYWETPCEMVVELTESDGYRCVGTKATVSRDDRVAAVHRQLPTEQPGLTIDEILKGWTDTQVAKPGRSILFADLRAADGILTTGAGKRGDPLKFYSFRPPREGDRG